MKVIDIVAEYLKVNGYDGLCADDCGCGLGSLVECSGECFADCVPAHKLTCYQGCQKYDDCCGTAGDVCYRVKEK